MIEPLRYNKEVSPPYEIPRPVFCHVCLQQKATRDHPNLATKFCPKCPTTLGADKVFGAYLCATCDGNNHKASASRQHTRYIMVVGPGVRKKLIRRGDGSNFPMSLDSVKIRLSSKVYHNGRRLQSIPAKEIVYTVGMSGKCLHIQVLGARNLMVGDAHGASDPYIVFSFCGKVLGSTRVRPRSVNPRWDNETFVVPMDHFLPAPREVSITQKDIVRLEVFDHDSFSSNEFLGHVEITRTKLMKIAMISEEKPIRLPLTMKEYHGFISVQLGHDANHLHIKCIHAEGLNKASTLNLSNPYAKIYLGNSFVVGITPTDRGTINPQWESGGSLGVIFKLKILQVLFAERYTQSQVDAYNETEAQKAQDRGERHQAYNQGTDDTLFSEFNQLPTNLAFMRIELYHDAGRFRKDRLLGTAYISLYKFRKMLPTLPKADITNLEAYSKYVSKTVKMDQKSAKLLQEAKKPWYEPCLPLYRVLCCKRQPSLPPSEYRPLSPAASSSGDQALQQQQQLQSHQQGSSRRRRGLLGAATSGATSTQRGADSNLYDRNKRTIAESNINEDNNDNINNMEFGEIVSAPSVEMISRPQQGGNDIESGLPPSNSRRINDNDNNNNNNNNKNNSDGHIDDEDRAALTLDTSFALVDDQQQQNESSRINGEGGSGASGSPRLLLPPPISSSSSSSNIPNASNGIAAAASNDGTGAGAVQMDTNSAPPLSSAVVAGRSSKSGKRPPPPAPMLATLASSRSGKMKSGKLKNRDDDDNDGDDDDEEGEEEEEDEYDSAEQNNRIRNNTHSHDPSGYDSADFTGTFGLADDSNAYTGSGGSFASNSLNPRRKLSRSMSIMKSFKLFAQDITWSDIYPLPVMLDSTEHRGMDAYGNAISQGFVVLRLIPAPRGNVLQGVDEAVRQMSMGETSMVKCRWDYAYGSYSMGEKIPPRSNFIFKIRLLSINNKGRFDMPGRVARRIYRFFKRRVLYCLANVCGIEQSQPLLPSHSSKKGSSRRKASISTRILRVFGLSSRDNDEDSLSDEDSEEEEGSDYDEEGMAGDEEEEEEEDYESVASSSEASDTMQRRVKPDPRMRKHLNKSVTSGAQLLWNYKPPPPAMPKKKSKKLKGESARTQQRHGNALSALEEEEDDEGHGRDGENGDIGGNDEQIGFEEDGKQDDNDELDDDEGGKLIGSKSNTRTHAIFGKS